MNRGPAIRKASATLAIVGWIVTLAAATGYGQALHVQPSLADLAATTDSDGIIPQPFLALTNANVVDVRAGSILGDVTLVLREGKIESVGTSEPPPGAEVVDLRGFYVTPGFFDGHYHGNSVESARRALASGVTTARGGSVVGYNDVAQREMVKAGYLAGPDILAAGIYLSPDLGRSDKVLADPRLYKFVNRPLRGEAAVREVVRINADRGVDWLKGGSGGLSSDMIGPDPLLQIFTDAELSAIVDEGSRFDLSFACHAHGVEVIAAAIRAGCASIEHGSYMNEENLQMMLDNGTLWVPTYLGRHELWSRQHLQGFGRDQCLYRIRNESDGRPPRRDRAFGRGLWARGANRRDRVGTRCRPDRVRQESPRSAVGTPQPSPCDEQRSDRSQPSGRNAEGPAEPLKGKP